MSESVTQNEKVLICLVCGWVYSEAEGDPASGVAPGTPWEEVPENWVCPECGVGKHDFTPIQL